MVQAPVMQPHPSIFHYRYRKCRCPGCRACNTEHKRSYRERRLANYGEPLRPIAQMPSTIARLRREIGIFAPLEKMRLAQAIQDDRHDPAQEATGQEVGADRSLPPEGANAE